MGLGLGCLSVTPPPPAATCPPPEPCDCPPTAANPPPRGELGWLEIRDPHYAADEWRWQYPTWAYDEVLKAGLDKAYDLRGAANPFLLNGDFDGDGRLDVAAYVESRTNPDEIGVVVVHRAGGAHLFLAGGLNWEVYPRQAVLPGVGEEGAPPILRGDALLFVKPESSSRLYYWDGSAYVGYQQGD